MRCRFLAFQKPSITFDCTSNVNTYIQEWTLQKGNWKNNRIITLMRSYIIFDFICINSYSFPLDLRDQKLRHLVHTVTFRVRFQNTCNDRMGMMDIIFLSSKCEKLFVLVVIVLEAWCDRTVEYVTAFAK